MLGYGGVRNGKTNLIWFLLPSQSNSYSYRYMQALDRVADRSPVSKYAGMTIICSLHKNRISKLLDHDISWHFWDISLSLTYSPTNRLTSWVLSISPLMATVIMLTLNPWTYQTKVYMLVNIAIIDIPCHRKPYVVFGYLRGFSKLWVSKRPKSWNYRTLWFWESPNSEKYLYPWVIKHGHWKNPI